MSDYCNICQVVTPCWGRRCRLCTVSSVLISLIKGCGVFVFSVVLAVLAATEEADRLTEKLNS